MTGELPDGWEAKALGDATVIVMGQSPPGSSYNAEGLGVPFFQGKKEFGDLHPTVVKWTTEGKKFAAAGDILMSVRAPVGPTNVADLDCAIGRGLAAIRAGEGLHPGFLLWNLRAFESEIAAAGTGTTFDAISGGSLKSQAIFLPPIQEQHRIVEILEAQLSRLDATLKHIQTLRGKAAQFRRSILHAAFTGALTGHDTSSSELPEGWEICRLDQLPSLDLFVDGDWVESKDQDPTGSVRLTQLADVGEGKFRDRSNRWLRPDQAEQIGVTYLKEGDLLVARMPDPIGRCCAVPELPSDAVTVVDVAILRPNGDLVDPSFLMWCLNSPTIRARILELASGTTRRRISRKNLGSVELLMPPVKEQNQIVAVIEAHLSRLDVTLAAADAVEKRAAALRRSLLHAAFTGKLTAKWREQTHA